MKMPNLAYLLQNHRSLTPLPPYLVAVSHSLLAQATFLPWRGSTALSLIAFLIVRPLCLSSTNSRFLCAPFALGRLIYDLSLSGRSELLASYWWFTLQVKLRTLLLALRCHRWLSICRWGYQLVNAARLCEEADWQAVSLGNVARCYQSLVRS